MPENTAFIAEVRRELENIDNPAGTFLKSFATLAVTLILFVAVGAIDWTPLALGILVVVLLVHETGHLIGMKAFGYRDVKMFFIPLFGAAVSGRPSEPSSARDALVSLLGPAPGIVIGLLLMIAAVATGDARAYQAGITFLFINAFNLLPFQPLDGGRIWNSLVFGRHPLLETGFRVLTVLALAGVALWMQAWLLVGLAVFMLLGTPATHALAVTARDVRADRTGPAPTGDRTAAGDTAAAARANEDDAGPDPLADEIALLNARVTTHAGNAKVVAQRVQELRRRVAERPASKRATAGLLGMYVVTVALVLVGVLMAIGVRTVGEAGRDGQSPAQVSTTAARTPEAHQDPGRRVMQATR